MRGSVMKAGSRCVILEQFGISHPLNKNADKAELVVEKMQNTKKNALQRKVFFVFFFNGLKLPFHLTFPTLTGHTCFL